MSVARYECRTSLRGKVRSYAVTDDALVLPEESVPLEDIVAIRVYTVPGMRTLGYGTVAQPSERCTIEPKSGRKIVLSNLHFLGLGRFEDRTASYRPFVRALVGNVAARCPAARLLSGMPPVMWWSWLVVFGSLAVVLGGFVLLAAVGLTLDGQMTWSSAAFLAAMALIAVGPVQYLGVLWSRRPHRLDPGTI